MKTKRTTRIAAIVLALLLIVPFALRTLPSKAYAVTQSDIDKVQQEREALSQKQQQSQSKIDELKEKKASVIEQKKALDERNTFALEQLKLIQSQIDMYTELIEEKALEVQAARDLESEQLQRYRMRVRAMEENGGFDLLTMLLHADSFAELLAAADDISQIMKADRELEDNYIAAREAHAQIQAEYETTKKALEARQEELAHEQEELEQMIREAVELIASLEEDIEKAQKEYEEAERARAAAEYMIGQLIAEINRQNAAIAAGKGGTSKPADSDPVPTTPSEPDPAPTAPAESDPAPTTPAESDPAPTTPSEPDPAPAATPAPETGSDLPSAGEAGVVGSGSLQWPVPSGHTVTSRYGMRIHPITGEEKFHSGMDIDGYNNEGGPIVACDDGVVVTAQWYGGLGNCVIIDHGNGMQTVYGHMSGFAVSVGSTVSKGQTIGYLGSTGVATGTHCHLEIFVNGSRVDPAGYFSGITYYDC